MAWQYFTIVQHGNPLDPAFVRYGRHDPDGPRYDCQTFNVDGEWRDSDRLERYHILGSNEDTLTDVSERQAGAMIRRSVELGRFRKVPDEPRVDAR